MSLALRVDAGIMARFRPHLRPHIGSWVAFAGCVLVVAVLDWAESVLLPIAVALLLTFLLNPPVRFLERWLPRVAAVLIVVTVTFATLSLVGWIVTRQVASLAAELPNYRANIRQKVLDIRRAAQGGPVEQVQTTLEEIKKDLQTAEAATGKSKATPVVVTSETVPGIGLPAWLSSLMEPLASAGLVTVLVVFMLLEQRDLRDRFLRLMGSGNLASTTKAFDEASERLSRYLLVQSGINVIYGAGVGIGLWAFGVPYPLLWAALGAMLRFIPYLGPWMAAGAPLLLAFAVLPDWASLVWVALLFIGLELFTNMVLETVLYAGVAGVTQVALIIAIAFWTWLWGPLGLLLATPLTLCLVVLGKHVRGLRLLAMLVADEPGLSPEARFYQRLLARQKDEAIEIVEERLREQPPRAVFEEVVQPAFGYAERDREAGRLTVDEAAEISQLAREIAHEAGAA
jgi:predicted PurR-regulated permease PerM